MTTKKAAPAPVTPNRPTIPPGPPDSAEEARVGQVDEPINNEHGTRNALVEKRDENAHGIDKLPGKDPVHHSLPEKAPELVDTATAFPLATDTSSIPLARADHELNAGNALFLKKVATATRTTIDEVTRYIEDPEKVGSEARAALDALVDFSPTVAAIFTTDELRLKRPAELK